MAQASGSNGLVSFRREQSFGVPDFPDVSGGGSSTISVAAAGPGATSIEVASATNFAIGDKIKVGDSRNLEYVEILSISSNVLTLHPNTRINYRHEIGEAVVEQSLAGFVKIGAITSYNLDGELQQFESGAIDGVRQGVQGVRSGNYVVNGNLTVEIATEGIGVFLAHALNAAYKSTGPAEPVTPAATTLANAAAIGDRTIEVAAFTNISVGDLLRIESGESAEIVKVDAAWGGASTTVDIEQPIRQAHADSSTVDEVISPFTHTIKRGSLPPGMSMLLHLSDIDSLALIRGAKINSLDLTLDPSGINTMSVSFLAQGAQMLQRDIFGTLTSVTHNPLVPWEAILKEGGSAIATVESMALNIENNISADRFTVGSRFIGAATEGKERTSGSIQYQYNDASLVKKAIEEVESSLNVKWTYTLDANHTLEIDLPRVKYGGSPHPALPDEGPITDTRSFTALRDATEQSDVKITILTTEYTLY